jgi:1,4-alpha-glucan branching enzyme
MTKKFSLILFLINLAVSSLIGQVTTTDPAIPIHDQPLTIYLNTNAAGAEELAGYTGDIYAHTGVNNWQYVIGDWNNNTTQPKLTKVTDTQYKLDITPSIRQFYGVPGSIEITRIAIVFRSADRSKQTRPDIFIDVFEAGLNVSFVEPAQKSNIIEFGENLTIRAAANESTSLSLFIDDTQVSSTTEEEVSYVFNSTTYGYGSYWAIAVATDGEETVKDSVSLFVRSEPTVADLPVGVIPGINYIDDNTVTLVLHDPPALKDYVFVIGDFNDWMVNEEGYMNRTTSGEHYWLTITGLEAGKEYGFQYFIDGTLKIADPYTEKVLDPWGDDEIIAQGRYPGLIPYPKEKTEHQVSVFQTARAPYVWQTNGFTPPAVEDLVIYELLIRDFLQNSTYKQLQDTLGYLKRLGINAIELMPVNEFEGNLSWGYNPSFYFAPDKFYGPRDELKKFIDMAHGMGIAVILDIVWNHSFGQSPLLRMYFDSQNNRPSTDNPWYSLPIFQNPAMNFGYKWDHGSPHFVEFMDRANRHWLEEYRVDGFRFDLTKGFTTKFKGSNDEWGSLYDQERVDNLKRLHDHLKSVNPNTYVILEHLADNIEEKVLADYGMLLWGNMNHNYNEATMGYHDGGKSNLTWGSYKARNWQYPHLITYMESHDEERLMYKNIQYGNSSGDYNIKDITTGLKRVELAAAFFFTIPGPKMIWQFGELGYDVSINFNGRVGVKPVRWEYYDDWRRKRLYDVFAMLIDLKKEHDVFSTNSYTLSVSGELKRINLNHASNNVAVIGNFGVTEATIIPSFQQTGTWHEFFSRQTINVSDINMGVTLQPGEYRLYSTAAFPDHGIVLNTPVIQNGLVQDLSVYPNPSTEGATISFDLHEKQAVSVNIYNIQGQKVTSLLNQDLLPDSYEIYWNRTTPSGNRVPAGIYLVEILSGENKTAKRLVLY